MSFSRTTLHQCSSDAYVTSDACVEITHQSFFCKHFPHLLRQVREANLQAHTVGVTQELLELLDSGGVHGLDHAEVQDHRAHVLALRVHERDASQVLDKGART